MAEFDAFEDQFVSEVMVYFSSSDDINQYQVDSVFDAVIQVKDIAKVKKYNRTYINFLTSDDVDGTVYCKGLYNLRACPQDYVALNKVKMDRNKGPKNMLNYDLVLTKDSKATVIYRNNMKVEIEIYPPTAETIDDKTSMTVSEMEEEDSDDPYVIFKRQNNKKLLPIYGTLLRDFGITQLEDEDNELINYHKSVVRTKEGQEIPILVDMKVKLPKLLRTGDKISFRGIEYEVDQVQGKMITNKYHIYEGTNVERDSDEVEPAPEISVQIGGEENFSINNINDNIPPTVDSSEQKKCPWCPIL